MAKKYGAYRFIKTRHQVSGVTWDEEAGKWTVLVKDLATGETITDTCDFFLSATGILNDWHWPEIPGLKDFKGPVVHSADWDDSLDLVGKRIALIGGGSSGIQILPTLQPTAAHIDHYNRSQMWIALGGFAGEEAFKRNPTGGSSRYSAEELAAFQKDPDAYFKYRAYVEAMLNVVHRVTRSDSDLCKMSEKLFRDSMQEKLASKPEVFASMNPSYPPVCRRITPGPGYLEAICAPNVDFISDPLPASHPPVSRPRTANCVRWTSSSPPRASTHRTCRATQSSVATVSPSHKSGLSRTTQKPTSASGPRACPTT